MNAFKKIYLILILLTVFSFGVIALVDTGNISIYGETGATLYSLAMSLLIGLAIMSRIGNIFGNRQNLFIGYLSAVVTLVYMILCIFEVVVIKSNSIEFVMNYLKVLSFFTALEELIIINVLIFEIPYVNDTHKNIQYVIAGIITLMLIVSFVQEKGTNFVSKYTSSDSYYSSMYDTDVDETSEDLQTIVGYSCIALFLINPMLRVFWIDKDYYNARDIYEEEARPHQLTVNDMGKVHTNDSHLNQPQVDPNAAPPVPVTSNNNNQGEMVEQTNEPRKIIPLQADDVIDPDVEFTEPVINKNFKPTEVSDISIPSVDGANNIPPTDPSNT